MEKILDYLLSRSIKTNTDNGYTTRDVLVFMPTYAPNKQVRQSFRTARSFEPYQRIVRRGILDRYEVPWTYLDAIDSIVHTLGRMLGADTQHPAQLLLGQAEHPTQLENFVSDGLIDQLITHVRPLPCSGRFGESGS